MQHPLLRSLFFSLCVAPLLVAGHSHAAEALKPFVLAGSQPQGDLETTVADVAGSLEQAGFEIVGRYTPYEGSRVIAFTDSGLRELATASERGGYGAVLRASVTRNGERVEVAYTNPSYWANAYRMQDRVEPLADRLQRALGRAEDFGSGELQLTAQALRKYHYTFMMEYFDDPSILNYFDSHARAVETVRRNLADGVAGASAVYEIALGKDTEGRPMTLFGVGLRGEESDDCSGDAYIMGRIDKDTPRHTPHLPYEILVYGDHAEALYARFRIAISWPHLPMIASDTGATFFSIMCSPGAIETALTRVAGGTTERPVGDR